MLCKNPAENADRKFRYHNVSLESVDNHIMGKQTLAAYYREQQQSETHMAQKQKLHISMNSLTDKQYQVLVLCVVHQLKQEEVARLLNCSQANISKIYKRAIEKLKKIMVK